MKIQKITLFEKWIYASVPLILVMSVPLVFIYELTGNPEVIAPFVPINRSLWELLKSVFYPTLVFWAAAYFASYKLKITKSAAMVGAALSAGISPFLTAGLYYFYICAFGIHSEVIDFVLVVMAVMIGQFFAHLVCCYICPSKKQGTLAFVAVFIMVAVVIICTYNPPRLPIFMDPENGSYSVNRLMD